METKLNKRQRLEAYVYAWFDIKIRSEDFGDTGFLCCAVRDWHDLNFKCSTNSDDLMRKKYWPELQKREPKNVDYVWFETNDPLKHEKRLTILEECIDELSNQLEK